MMPQEMQDLRIAEMTKKLPVKHVADGDEVADAYLFCMKYVIIIISHNASDAHLCT